VTAQTPAGAHAELKQLVDQNASNWKQVSKQIWAMRNWAITNQKFIVASGAVEAAGFQIEAGVADEPTAFIASYGEGKPVIGILASSTRCLDSRKSRCPRDHPCRPVRQATAAGTTCWARALRWPPWR